MGSGPRASTRTGRCSSTSKSSTTGSGCTRLWGTFPRPPSRASRLLRQLNKVSTFSGPDHTLGAVRRTSASLHVPDAELDGLVPLQQSHQLGGVGWAVVVGIQDLRPTLSPRPPPSRASSCRAFEPSSFPDVWLPALPGPLPSGHHASEGLQHTRIVPAHENPRVHFTRPHRFGRSASPADHLASGPISRSVLHPGGREFPLRWNPPSCRNPPCICLASDERGDRVDFKKGD